MCPPLFRVVVVPCVVCFLLLLQQCCVSVAQNNVDKEQKIADMDKSIIDLKKQVTDLQKFVAKQQQTKTRQTRRCPVGAMRYHSDCLLFVHKPQNWTEVVDHCASMMGKPVSITSTKLYNHIKAFLRAQLGRRGVEKLKVLTGLIYTVQESKLPAFIGIGQEKGAADGWYWYELDGRNNTHLDSSNTHWKAGEPNATQAFSSCCMYLVGDNDLNWVPTQCNQKMSFICHFKAVSTRSRRRNKGRKKKKKGAGRKRERRKC